MITGMIQIELIEIFIAWNYNPKIRSPEDFGGLKFEFVPLESAIETNRAKEWANMLALFHQQKNCLKYKYNI